MNKCNFCGKKQDQVKKLIAGPGVYICNDCINICQEIVDEDLGDKASSETEPDIFVVMNNGVIETAVLSANVALSKVIEDIDGEATIKIFSGFSGELKKELKKMVPSVTSEK